jgi:hypothetical protein
MRMILWWQRTHAHKFLGADLDDLNAEVVVEMRNNFIGHVLETLYQRLELQRACLIAVVPTVVPTG